MVVRPAGVRRHRRPDLRIRAPGRGPHPTRCGRWSPRCASRWADGTAASLTSCVTSCPPGRQQILFVVLSGLEARVVSEAINNQHPLHCPPRRPGRL